MVVGEKKKQGKDCRLYIDGEIHEILCPHMIWVKGLGTGSPTFRMGLSLVHPQPTSTTAKSCDQNIY